jgi:hypothetical protein
MRLTNYIPKKFVEWHYDNHMLKQEIEKEAEQNMQSF